MQSYVTSDQKDQGRSRASFVFLVASRFIRALVNLRSLKLYLKVLLEISLAEMEITKLTESQYV